MKKHLNFYYRSLLFLAFFSIFSACSNEIVRDSPETLNLFESVIAKRTQTINTFSKDFSQLNFVDRINIQSHSNDELEFTLNSKRLFLNGKVVGLNSITFNLTKNGDNEYKISSDYIDFSMTKILDNDYKILLSNGEELVINGSAIMVGDDIERFVPVYAFLLKEFTDRNISHIYSTEGNYLTKSDKCAAATGVGFHLGKADAKEECESDFNQILADNPTWSSPGVSYSCFTDEHICVCTANFFKPCDTDTEQ